METIDKIIKEGIVILYKKYFTEYAIRPPFQCFKCNGIGHIEAKYTS